MTEPMAVQSTQRGTRSTPICGFRAFLLLAPGLIELRGTYSAADYFAVTSFLLALLRSFSLFL